MLQKERKNKRKKKRKQKKLEKAIQLSETGANLSSSFAPPEESSPPLADQSPRREKGISSSGQGSGRSEEVLDPLPVRKIHLMIPYIEPLQWDILPSNLVPWSH
ncbi:uncharacterized protein LOC113321483 [Papaver somniferum]|uniref:uncharacterized protein LOC113321483 n=1 Tax=Papaver somniferum TaxID=3469 RepID=UPI000E6F9D47|nr:uncharacterized protein LOC113321483 [Papaver somniferum]